MKTKILALLCIPFIIGACSSPEEPVNPKGITIHIEKIVTDATTSKPIDDATVVLYRWSQSSYVGPGTGGLYRKNLGLAVTNHEGWYSINEPIQEGWGGYGIHILATAKGYETVDSNNDLDTPDPRRTEELQIIDFQLTPIN